MPYRPNIIPKCTHGFLSSITNSLSFLTLGIGVTACNSKSMSTGGNLAEVRFKILRLCDFEEMDVCSVGGLALSKPYSTSGQAGKETCRRFFVSKCSLDFSPIFYLTAGGPQNLESSCLPSQNPCFLRVTVKRNRGIRLFVLAQSLRWCCVILFGVFGTVLFLLWAQTRARKPASASEEEEEEQDALRGDVGPRRSRLW